MIRVGRYWHTLRHLRVIQFYARIRFRLTRPTPDPRAAPPRRTHFVGPWVAPAPHRDSLIGRDRFQLLNQTHSLDEHGWDDAALDKLWRYNLHYFDDLTAPGAGDRVEDQRALLERWVRENPPGRGTGWEPYPTSLRIVNWVKWSLAGNELPAECVQSLAVQARWLRRRLEWHLLANHLLANAKALVVAGLYFQSAEADRWREKGLALLARELAEQICADGGHFERSPMYHAMILEDVLDLINTAHAAPGVIDAQIVLGWCDIARRMHGWLLALSHPDGQIAFFNDASFDIAPTPGQLAAYASRLRLQPPSDATPLTDSGYRRATRGVALLIADLAPVGADYQPGHAHADTLSFEFSLDGHRLFVNSGTSTYAPGPQRVFERSTAAHNTVEIDGEDSSEVWSAFRVARRARPGPVTVTSTGDDTCIKGSHDGYSRLAGSAIHSREWRLEDQRLRITDRIDGRFERAMARCYLHPLITPQRDHNLLLPNGRICRWTVTGGYATLVKADWYPEFGRSEASHCLEIAFSENESILEVVW